MITREKGKQLTRSKKKPGRSEEAKAAADNQEQKARAWNRAILKDNCKMV